MSREDRDVPSAVRREVVARDNSSCRVCGVHVPYPALHHIQFRSAGGLHVPQNLVVVGWLPGHECHLTYAHGPQAREFREYLGACALSPGVTAFQLRRWSR